MKYILSGLLSVIFISLYSQNKVVDQVIAVVGKNIIIQSEIEDQYIQLLAQGYYSDNDIKCDILENLLFQKLLLDQAELDSIEITTREVEYAMDNRFRQLINQFGSEEKLEEMLGKSILEMKTDLKEEMKNHLLTQKMQGKITEDIKITPAEVRNYFKKIPEDSLPVIGVEYEIEQIVRHPVISADEKAVVKEKLNGFRERIINGEKFSTLAVLYSEDPGSARKGGELGFVSRNDLVSEFAAVAFNLKTTDEVSRIVETEFGFHIIQLIEKKGELVNVRHILLSPKVAPEEMVKAKSYLDSIASLIRIDTLTFARAAEKFSDDDNSKLNGGLMVNPYTMSSRFTEEDLDATTRYMLKNMREGDISKPYESKDIGGKTVYKIIRLRKIVPEHKVNLKDDYQKIQDIALEDKKQEAINEWIRKKQKICYIHIDDSYRNCRFQVDGWIK